MGTTSAPKDRVFELRHVVGFEETNLVGNVYYVNHIKWQGRCREMFLKLHCPEILDELRADLALATVRCQCEYFLELEAFDEIVLRMKLGFIRQNRIELRFDYLRARDGWEELIARGEQEIACLRRMNGAGVPTQIPPALARALLPFAG